jgi:hypothetical protein
MRIITTLISVLYFGILPAQTPGHNELYKRIVDYYQQNPMRLEFVKRVHKNIFRYDTTISSFAYFPLEKNEYYLFFIDSTYLISGGILRSDQYYVLNANSPEKILLKSKDLKSSMQSKLSYIPAWHCNSMIKIMTRFGLIKSIKLDGDKFIAVTQKSTLLVDTLTFRVTKIIENVPYKKEYHQYDEFYYIQLDDSLEKSIKEQVLTLVEASKKFPTTTFDELEKQKPLKENLEGKPFEFKNLVSLNKGPVDSIIKGKYVIFDFFYQACLPCHKMTGYILDWLPKVDTTKIILVGINPADSEYSMKIEIENRKINYPVIIGTQAKEIAHRYVQEGYPNLLLVSPDGIILQHRIGMSKSFLSNAEKIISQ